MEKKNGALKKLLSLVTYKDTAMPKSFEIPEVTKEEQETPSDIVAQSSVSEGSKQSHARGSAKKETIKPIPSSQQKGESEKNSPPSPASDNLVSTNITLNIEYMKKKFNFPVNKDLVIREFTIKEKHKAFIMFLDGMADRTIINHFILHPLLSEESARKDASGCTLDYILDQVIEINQVKKLEKPDEVIYGILMGDTCLYVDGCDYYLVCETKGFDKRSVEKPVTESVVKGSQEAFNENLRTDTTLIRRIIKNSNLTTEFLKIGSRNNNMCAIMYLHGLVNPAIVKEVKRRINSLKTDFISGSGMLEQFIEENSWSIIPTTLSTERPDRAAAHIMEGRVVIIAEGTPFALVVPITLSSLFHSPEDVTMRWQYGTMMRFVRICAFALATLLPGLYVALTYFHREMIPTDLLLAIAKARENVPFPTIVEIIFMEFAFELIREAGIRIPGIIGNTIGIIGGLILGQAAVQANLVSPVLIIVISITGLGNFSIPDFNMSYGARIIRLFFIAMGAFIGFYGITLGLLVISVIITNIKSFGIFMMSPVAPKTRKSHDFFIRRPVWQQENMPDDLNTLEARRQPKISRPWMNEEPYHEKGKKEGEQDDSRG